ncbi:MAG: FtsX-like permease family protein, partial [Dehalococcoidales bacterium]|nr:FtsX-like permease family protein [Dehalococcoidales bacterium]
RSGGPAGLPDDLYRQLRVTAGVRPLAPVVESDVAAVDFPGRTFHLLGVDPFAEGPFRPYLSGAGGTNADLSALLVRPGSVLLASDTAAELGLAPGDTFTIGVAGVRKTVTLVGLLQPSDEPSRRALDGLLVADISSAQELLGTPGRLSHIDLLVPEGATGEEMLGRVRAALPPGAELIRSTSRTETLEQMTNAFNLNLTALSLLALVVGMFLIYNTMTFSVVQRRPLIGTLRALGVTRGEIFTLVLGETLVIGLVGTIAGLLLGVVLGRGLVRLVTQTINDLYFVVSVRDLAISPLALAKGAILGTLATFLAALLPALEATSAPPRAVLSRSTIEQATRRALPRVSLAGLALLAGGTALLFIPGENLIASFAALLLIVLGFALLTPGATVVLMRLMRPPLGRLFGSLGRMASRGVVASLSRTAVAVAALMIAVSVTVGVGIMVDSFRGTVVQWLDTTLQADVYVSPPSLVSNRSDSWLPAGLVQKLSTAPGVASVNTYGRAVIES